MKILSFDIGVVNMAYCILDSETKNISHWEVFSLCNGTEIENTKDLVRKLDERPFVLDCDLVLLEKQPSFNPKMRIMAEAVRSYLIIRGLVDNNKTFKLMNYSPKHKLNCYDKPMPDELKMTEEQKADKTTSGKGKLYRIRKKQSIYHCEQLIKDQSEEIKSTYEVAQKKKDDLADCYLQVLSYVMFEANKKKQGPIIKRKPTKRQTRYKKYSKNNLKFMLIEFLDKNLAEVKITDFIECKGKTIDDKLKEFINLKGILKNLKRLYGIDYTNDEIKAELVPSDYLEKQFK